MKQVYKITNLKNMKSYIGISIAENQSHMDRFEKHMTGMGGVWIKKDLDEGLATRDDFIIELLEEGNESDEYYKAQEEFYIEHFDTLYPKGYNGNKGNYIILTEEIKQKIRETWQRNRDAGKHKKSNKNKGKAIWRYPDGSIKRLSCDHEDVINGVVKHINYNPDSKIQRGLRERIEQRLRNNGLTDAQVAHAAKMKEIAKTYVHNPGWQEGRRKFRERMAKKDFTDKQLEAISERPDNTKRQWASITHEEKMTRVGAGLSEMNSKIQCPHCGIATNKGNYNRWHGSKCKNIITTK